MLRQSVIKNDVKCFSKNTQMSHRCRIVSHDKGLIYQGFATFYKKNVAFTAIVSGEAFAEWRKQRPTAQTGLGADPSVDALPEGNGSSCYARGHILNKQ